jgi:serine/threonine-protein kinase
VAEIAPQVDGVLSGLAAAHAVGIVHRDLKPENLLIDRYRRWRIADFGIANPAGEEITGASGTPAFSPPEQLLGEPQEAPADCFSLAAIVVFALTGQAPFGDNDPKTILARELAGRIDLSAFAPEIAAWLTRGFSPDPNDRFADAAEMQTEWRTAAGAVLERERRLPWWRRIFGADEAGDGWWHEGTLVGE